MPSLLIVIPLFLLLFINLPLGKALRKAAFWLALLLFLLQAAVAVLNLPLPVMQKLMSMDVFLKIDLPLDAFGAVALFCIGLVCFTSLLVSGNFMDEDRRFNFINVLIIASIGMCGVILVQDLFSMYVYLEITGIASFILIAFDRDAKGLEGSFKYIMLSAVATVLMLTSISLIFLSAGSVSFAAAKGLLAIPGNVINVLAIALFLCGAFIKSGVVPFHGWLPDAYSSAPPPVAILLAGIVTKISGVYVLIRVVLSVFGLNGPMRDVIMVLGAASIIVGALAAFNQKHMKKLLAWSSVSQIGYIVLGFAVGNVAGLVGAIFHFFNHAMFKSLLFVNAAAVEKSAGTDEMDKLGGVSEAMPVTGVTSVVGVLSTAGIPPLSGFWSKLLIIIGLWQAHHHIYALIAVVFSVVTLGYLLYMQRKVFWGKLAAGLSSIKEAGFGPTFAAILLALINVGVGVAFPFILNKYIVPVKELLGK